MRENKLINGNPHWKAAYEIAETFYNIIESEGKDLKVSMLEMCAAPCGTIACHAGWFLIANNNININNFKSYDYSCGGRLMSRHLGFSHLDDLELWANHNPKIWGNDRGSVMFSSNVAFGIRKFDTITLKNVADHWAKVAKRLYKIQNKKP